MDGNPGAGHSFHTLMIAPLHLSLQWIQPMLPYIVVGVFCHKNVY